MKQKLLLLLSLSFLSVGLFAQTTTNIFIDGTLAGQIQLNANQNTGGLSYSKSTYKNIDRLSIEIKGKSVDGGYYRKVEVMGDGLTPMLVAEETVGAVGQFIITDKNIIKRLKKGNAVSLYVVKTPANTKSTEMVSRVYLGTLTREK